MLNGISIKLVLKRIRVVDNNVCCILFDVIVENTIGEVNIGA